jgi:hypothetical protein
VHKNPDSAGLISCCVPVTYLFCFILISTISLFILARFLRVFLKTMAEIENHDGSFDEEFVAIDE